MSTFTVIVAKDVTCQRPEEAPFTGHHTHRLPATPRRPDGRLVAVRYRHTDDLGWALRYWRIWRKEARRDGRYRVLFRVGAGGGFPAVRVRAAA